MSTRLLCFLSSLSGSLPYLWYISRAKRALRSTSSTTIARMKPANMPQTSGSAHTSHFQIAIAGRAGPSLGSLSGMYTGRVQRDSAGWDSAVLSRARVGFSQCSKHRNYRVASEFGAMRARIAYERLNELQRRRLIRRTSAHNPMPLLIGEHREVLHRLHISPTGQRFRRAWDVDVPPGSLSAALEALTIACQLARVFDCSRRGQCKGPGHNQPYRQDARIFHRRIASSRIPRGLPWDSDSRAASVESVKRPSM